MVPTELLLAFAAAALAIISMPGPTVLLVTGYALTSGQRIAMLSIAGVLLGDAAAMTLTFLGLGAILAASAALFVALKWIGVVYLLYLGIQLWRAPVLSNEAESDREQRPLRIVARGFTVNVLHPKGLAFYAVFLPQFITPKAPAVPQMLTLGLTFLSIAFCVLTAYALAASRFRAMLAQPWARSAVNRSGAACLIGASLYTASVQRN